MTPAHARTEWTDFQRFLAGVFALAGAAILIFGFLDIYHSVTHLLYAWWGNWSWTVILLSEGSFTGCYAGWLLLALRDRPPRRITVFVVAYLTTFAAGGMALMLYAGRGSVPDLISHGAVSLAFFGFLLFVKVVVHRLTTDPADRQLEVALADARRHAIDLIRDRVGPYWRITAPGLLRRQVTSGRFPAKVVTAVRDSLTKDGAPWEDAVGQWVADGLAVTVKADAAHEAIRQEALRRAHETAHETTSETGHETAHGTGHETPARDEHEGGSGDGHEHGSGDRSRRRPRPRPRQMTDDDLMPYVRDALAEDPGASIGAIRRATLTGPDRAKRLLERGQQEAREARMSVVG